MTPLEWTLIVAVLLLLTKVVIASDRNDAKDRVIGKLTDTPASGKPTPYELMAFYGFLARRYQEKDIDSRLALRRCVMEYEEHLEFLGVAPMYPLFSDFIAKKKEKGQIDINWEQELPFVDIRQIQHDADKFKQLYDIVKPPL